MMVLSSLVGAVMAQQPDAPVEKRELIYCADQMTHEEREANRAKMQAARTRDEKSKIRANHQADMHEVCLDCHGTGLYVKPDCKIKSLDALRKETLRWGDYYNPALSPQDVDDVVAYLNRDFYQFK